MKYIETAKVPRLKILLRNKIIYLLLLYICVVIDLFKNKKVKKIQKAMVKTKNKQLNDITVHPKYTLSNQPINPYIKNLSFQIVNENTNSQTIIKYPDYDPYGVYIRPQMPLVLVG